MLVMHVAQVSFNLELFFLSPIAVQGGGFKVIFNLVKILTEIKKSCKDAIHLSSAGSSPFNQPRSPVNYFIH
jgi:hypothetical protein